MLNKFEIQGRFVSDPELKTTNGGISVCRFALACSRNHKNAQGNYEADFFNFVAWRSHAERIAKNCKKGDMLIAFGSIQNQNYEKDGVKQHRTEFVVEEIHFCNNKNRSTDANTSYYDNSGGAYSFEGLDPDDSELPFNN